MRLFFLILLLSGCASNQPITKWGTPELRVMVNPRGIDADSYAAIMNALVSSNKYFVVDRSEAFQAVWSEQNLTRVDYENRFDDAEKFARLRKLYGVGAVIQGHQNCANQSSFWHGGFVHCYQYLSIVSTSTGQVIAAASSEEDAPPAIWGGQAPGPKWDRAVEKLNAAFPANFEPEQWSPDMMKFKKVLREESQRERENE